MINAIIDEISKAIYAEFGEDYKIYAESIEQGLQEPCFSIVCVNPTDKLYLGLKGGFERHQRTNQFCIHYFPSGNIPTEDGEDVKGKNQECFDVMDVLIDVLEFIGESDDQYHGTDMHGEIEDGVLNFFVNYNFFTHKVSDEDNYMDELEQTTNVKG